MEKYFFRQTHNIWVSFKVGKPKVFKSIKYTNGMSSLVRSGFQYETPACEAPLLLLFPPRGSLNCPDLTESLPVMQTRVTAAAYMSILAPPICQRTPLSKAHPADAVELIGEEQEGGDERVA